MIRCGHLTPTQSAIMAVLTEKIRVSHDEMIEAVFPDPDKAPAYEVDSLKTQIWHIRNKMDPPATIETVRGFGWQLKGPGIPEFSDPLPIAAPVTPLERRILSILSDGRAHSLKSILSEMYEWRTPPKTARTIYHVCLCHLRRKLKPGWRIEARPGSFWQLVQS